MPINSLLLEIFDEDHWCTFLLINQLDDSRQDLQDPCDAASALEDEYGPLTDTFHNALQPVVKLKESP